MTPPPAQLEFRANIAAARAFSFDLTAACKWFLHCLSQLQKIFKFWTSLIVIGAETLSTVDWSDRSTAVLFGDGAGFSWKRAKHVTSQESLYTDGFLKAQKWLGFSSDQEAVPAFENGWTSSF